jgi:hypothetical protein
VGVQILPSNPKDLAIAAKSSHLLCYDNVRGIKPPLSDALCIAATGGALSCRELYTDDGLIVIHLHCAVILNGLHEFLTEPDLAQRSMPIHLKPINEKQRKSEAEMAHELDQDLPVIMRGLYDLIAGVYQAAYSDNLKQAQLDSLLENPLAAAIVGFAEELTSPWEGEPTKLLTELSYHTTPGMQRSSLWPSNAIALTKRAQSFQAALKTQGVFLEFGRGKKRRITITTATLNENF